MEIESPLGKSTFNTPPRQTFTVPDGGYSSEIREMTPEERKQLEEMRAKNLSLKDKASPEAKKRAEYLCQLGRLKTECEVDGTKFYIRSLRGTELEDILVAIADVKPLVLGLRLRAETLARAVYMIDGQTVQLVLGTNKIDDIVEHWRQIDDNVAEFIHDKYKDLAQEAEKKYSVKNKEDLKKVADDVKKS